MHILHINFPFNSISEDILLTLKTLLKTNMRPTICNNWLYHLIILKFLHVYKKDDKFDLCNIANDFIAGKDSRKKRFIL